MNFDTYYTEALQKQPQQDAYIFLSPDTTPQIKNKKESSTPAKFDIEKIYEENIPYRENIYKKIYNGI